MKTIEMIDRLREKPVFSLRDVERISGMGKPYGKQVLSRLIKRGLVGRVTRDVYTTKDNIMMIASNITYPSYISFWFASSFLGYTEQMPLTIGVATTRRMKPIKYKGYKIKFIPLKHFFGYRKITTEDGDIFVAEDEKLLLDAFLASREFGNFDEITKIFSNATITESKIIEYLKRAGNKTLVKRVGFLLEKEKGIDISKEFELDRNYVLLNPLSRKWKSVDRKWRVKI